jgi:hypothetical protein
MIVERPDGSLFVAGYGEARPTLWRSVDGGASWDSVHVGTEAEGAVGNSDVDLALGTDGTMYFIAMSFDRQVFEGTGISVGATADAGTWTWVSLSRDRFDDRPWIEVDPAGAAHAIWNDGSGVSHAVSADRGASWQERPRVHSTGGSSHFAIGPNGTLAVRLTPLSASGNRFDPETDAVAVSSDGGDTWRLRELPGNRTWSQSFDPNEAVLRWVEPVAWDSAGALFTLWSEGHTLWLGRSGDQGDSWAHWPIVEDTSDLFFPYLIARRDGELAATWFSGVNESLRAHLAEIRIPGGSGAPPRVTHADPFEIQAYSQADPDSSAVPEPAGEYIPVIFLRDGRLAVVSPIQDPVNERWGFTFRPYARGADR